VRTEEKDRKQRKILGIFPQEASALLPQATLTVPAERTDFRHQTSATYYFVTASKYLMIIPFFRAKIKKTSGGKSTRA